MSLTRTRTPNRPAPKSNLVFWSNDRSLAGYANHAPVTQYLDLTGRGDHLTIPSATFAPSATVSGLNGKSTLQFNANNTSFLSGSTVLSGTSARSIYLVANIKNVGTETILDLCGAGGVQFFGVTCELGVRTGVAGRCAFGAPTGSVWAIYTLRLPDGGGTSDLTARINSVASAQTALVTGTINTSAATFVLGGGPSAGTVRYDGQIAEVRIYAANHTDAQALRVENQLKRYWGL